MSDFFFGLTTLAEGCKGGWPISKAASTALNKIERETAGDGTLMEDESK